MRGLRVPAALAALLAAHLCHAFSPVAQLSFGHAGRLSADDDPGRVPNFALLGQPQPPTLLSNKVILTPVALGNQRGAIWAEAPLMHSPWEADVEFRANGPERGGGNLNIWLVRGGSHDIASHSIYTVGRFDGLSLVVDAHGGSGGMIRGFLNDGSVDFAQEHDIDRRAFGHCQYSYRNLGRPSLIKMRHTDHSFTVEVDGGLCFETAKVSLPPGYHFGITAATPDIPDSFEVFKLAVTSDSTVPGDGGHDQHAAHQEQPAEHGAQHNGDTMPDEPANHFTTSEAQFQDLHDRLQSAMHHISAVDDAVRQHRHEDDQRHAEIKHTLEALRAQMASLHQAEDLLSRVKELEKVLLSMRHDINSNLATHHHSLRESLSDHHSTLAHAVTSSMPGHGKLIVILVGTQAVLVAAYVMYKRRRANSPKKYL